MWQNLEGDERSKAGFFKMKENVACLYSGGNKAIERKK